MSIGINMDKAKDIGHQMRRQQRAEEFAPFDKAIAIRLPGADLDAIEEKRQAIREKYALIEDVIDGATTPEEIKLALEANKQ
jgi:predicted DNA binding CopG/RHH family protein